MAARQHIPTLLPDISVPSTIDSARQRLITLPDRPEHRLWWPLDILHLATTAACDLDTAALTEDQASALMTLMSSIWPATSYKTRGKSFKDELMTYFAGDDAADAETATRARVAAAPSPPTQPPPPAAPSPTHPAVAPRYLPPAASPSPPADTAPALARRAPHPAGRRAQLRGPRSRFGLAALSRCRYPFRVGRTRSAVQRPAPAGRRFRPVTRRRHPLPDLRPQHPGRRTILHSCTTRPKSEFARERLRLFGPLGGRLPPSHL